VAYFFGHPVFDVITECGCTGHAYADDTQVYVSTPAEDHSDAVDRLASCFIRVRDWPVHTTRTHGPYVRVVWTRRPFMSPVILYPF